MKVTPYFSFAGNAYEAIELYKQAFDAEITYKILYKENEKALKERPEFADKIMHATLKVGEWHFYLADDLPRTVGDNMAADVTFDTLEQLEKAFDVLKQGGTINVEPEDTFWGARYAFVTDKFGNGWSLHFAYPNKE